MGERQDIDLSLTGIGVSPGIAIGPAFLFTKDAYHQEKALQIAPEEVDHERTRFERAVSQSEKELLKISDVAREKIGEESADIFHAQAMMLRDVALYNEVIWWIEHELIDASTAVQQVVGKHRQRIEGSDNDYLRERADDLVDVQSRLQRNLQRGRIFSNIDMQSVVVAENLTAADVILFSRRSMLGCAMDFGGPTSHVALIARSLGIPAVFSLHQVSKLVSAGDIVIVDGLNGKLILRPSEETRLVYEERRERYLRLRTAQESLIPLPAETIDGTPISLFANVEVEEELPVARRYGAEGIGLFRTEILFFAKGKFPTEDEQVAAYSNALAQVYPAPATFRLFDLGGDKVLPLANREHNPFLGWRGIRILLQKTELLKTQVRAILRASAGGSGRLLLPMVTTVREIREFKTILEGEKADLRSQGVPFDEHIPVGVMVEVPSVALMIEDFAPEVDFFSIGTNDLTQYVLAVDRGNDLVANLYEELHPALLRLIRHVIVVAKEHNLPVSVCGEMAAHPKAVPILLGLGLEQFSVSPSYLLDIKRVVRAITIDEAREIAGRALRMKEAGDVERLVDEWLTEHGCDPDQLLEDVDMGEAGRVQTNSS